LEQACSWIKIATKDIISSDAPLGLSSGIKILKNLLIFKVAIECKPKACYITKLPREKQWWEL
jgi:hypothetical protein